MTRELTASGREGFTFVLGTWGFRLSDGRLEAITLRFEALGLWPRTLKPQLLAREPWT